MAIPAQDRQTLAQFIDWSLGQVSVAKYNDGNYLGECVSLINQYCWRVLNVPADAWGHAKDWASNGNVAKYFDKVTSLKAGDILVYGANFGGGYGHIEICLGGGLVLGQNRDGKRKVGRYKTLAGYTTILRLKGAQDMTKIPDADNYYWRYGIDLASKVRGRELTRDEFRRHIVGATDLQAVERLSDDPEAATAQHWQNIGKLAVKDNWQQQIYDLRAENAKKDIRIGQLEQERNAARDESAAKSITIQSQEVTIADLKAQLAVTGDDTKNLNALGQALQWAIKRLGLK